MKKDVLKNFPKFAVKYLCQSLLFNKVADLRPATLLKKRLYHRCFPVNFAKFLRTLFFAEHLQTSASDNAPIYFGTFQYSASFVTKLPKEYHKTLGKMGT